jgi:serine/threonine protein kinase
LSGWPVKAGSPILGAPRVIDIGSVVNGKYRLVRVLGDGGMGSVYEAHHVALGTRVAIKVLHPELARRTGLVERFLQEARVAAQIRSPHIVQVTDVDRTPEGYAYIVMELLEGEPLSSVLDRQHRLAVPIACAYVTQILQALEAAHALGVIHRDLKPENVFVTFVGGKPTLKLIDFGIAKARPVDAQQKKLTVAGVVMGTAEYMAPEQARSADKVDARADIYAVGVMLYEMIAGARPVNGDDARVIALRVERGDVIPLLQVAPETPPEIAGLVHRAMAARPELRFPSATEMRLAVEAGAAGRRSPTAAMTGVRKAAGTVDLSAGPGGAAPRGPSASFASAGSSFGTAEQAGPAATIRAPPLATALVAAGGYAGAALPVFSAIDTSPSRWQSRKVILGLVALALLLGAGVAGVALFGLLGVRSGGPAGSTGESGSAAGLGAPSAKSVASTIPDEPLAAAKPTDLPSLMPTKVLPSPVPARPAPSPASRPSAGAPDAAATPPAILFPPSLPSGLPPFPSGFSLPAGFPTALPSGFPTALPNGFPTAFPAWPPAAPSAGGPNPTPSSSAGGAVY